MTTQHYVELGWGASPSPISGYNIYRGVGDGPISLTPINTSIVTGLTYSDRTVFAGFQYHYQVKSVLGAIESESSVDLDVPIIPFDDVPVIFPMGAANSFGVLAATTITAATAETTIKADLGLYPGTSVTGFPPAMVLGSFHVTNTVAAKAMLNATTVKSQYMALPGGVTIGGDLGNSTIGPGLYKVATSTGVGSGILVLDGGGDSDAVWVFQVGTTLITAASTSIILAGGAQASNVYWMVGTSATLGAASSFSGNIIASASISVADDVAINGRIIALTGAITFAGKTKLQCFERSTCVLRIPDVLPELPPPARPAAPTQFSQRVLS